jgi:hypothetical protein
MVGRLPAFRASIPCVVIGEGWPAWLPVMSALGAKAAAVVCPTGVLWGEGNSWNPMHLEIGSLAATKFLSSLTAEVLVFVSGSATFMMTLAGVLPTQTKLVLALDMGNRVSSRLRGLYPGVGWRNVVHADFGGVTTAGNWIGSGQGIELGPMQPAGYNRTVGEVLKPVLRGRFGPGRPPPGETPSQKGKGDSRVWFEGPGLVSPKGLWPVSKSTPQVVAPSIFSTTNWVWRNMTAAELGAAWDLPVEMIGELRESLEAEADQLLRMGAVCRTAPCKSLWAFGQSMLCFGLLSGPSWNVQAKGQERTGRLGFGMLLDKEGQRAAGEAAEQEDERLRRGLREIKAAKADDAEVPVYLWNERVLRNTQPNRCSQEVARGLDFIRSHLLLPRWRVNLLRGFLKYMGEEHGAGWKLDLHPGPELSRDLAAGRDALTKGMGTSWWNWDAGSSLFFWRWPRSFRTEARDGTPIWVCDTLPNYRRPQREERDPVRRAQIWEKLTKVRSRGYVLPGRVNSLTGYFAVGKDETDIRMVYDASKSGLNDALWAPTFGLPTVESTLRGIETDSYLGDLDLGEMFLNFKLDVKMRAYAGVDLSCYPAGGMKDNPENQGVCWERWERCLMGLKPSPFNATKAFAWGEEVIRGDRKDKANPLHWDRVRLNLPGEEAYDPTLPWVSKVGKFEGGDRIAGDFFTYIDDVRTSGRDREHCWEVSRRVASHCSYLGIQDAPRKRRAPSSNPGAWAGSNVVLTPEGVAVTVSPEKWGRTRDIVMRWWKEVKVAPSLNRKALESDAGFLVYVVRSFPAMRPYLKGIHLTLHGWRPGRDEEGWKLLTSHLGREREEWPGEIEDWELEDSEAGVPDQVSAVGRLEADLGALLELTESPTPPLRLVRPREVRAVRYGFGDASGTGFGSTFTHQGEVVYRHGVWGSDGKGKSSNWRELHNLVATLELEAREGRLQGCEVFIFTDNSTAEAAFFRGTSSSELLFQLVLRLRKLEVHEQCLLHVVHVAGTRMIGQGADGLSRGNLTEGVMSGHPMTSFVPLGKSALERSPALVDWIRTWTGENLTILSPDGWFERGQGIVGYEQDELGRRLPIHEAGSFLWSPPPAAAGTAVEELRRSRHKSHDSVHVFVCPRLMTNLWRKLVLKEADLVFEVPVGASVWNNDMFEPLLIGICLPFIPHRPWKLGGSPKLLGLARQLRHVWQDPTRDPGAILRELLELPRRLSSLPAKLVWRVLHTSGGR